MAEIVREGGCGCGALRYRVTGEPISVNNCHCKQCQHQTGSTSVVNALFEAECVTLLSGTLTRNVVKAGSGGPHEIVRCSACGVAVWSHYPRFGKLAMGVRAGTLDDTSTLRPDAVIFTAEAMPWVAFPPGIPKFERSYNFAEVLPPDRAARLQKIIDRRQAGQQ